MATADINLCLLGKTGTGKSATGNSILDWKAFESGPSTSSITTEVTVQTAEITGRKVTVVDGPGVGDTRLTKEDDIQASTESLGQVVSACPGGYHALLLMFRYGTRYTQEDRDVLAALKTFLGADFVHKHAILVVTCGDVLEREMAEEDDDGSSSSQLFSKWLDDQTEDLADLLKELDGRAVLFNNKTKDPSVLDQQRAELFKAVEDLSTRGLRYSQQDFLASALSRQVALVESKREKVYNSTKQALDAVSSELTSIMSKPQVTTHDILSNIKSIENLQGQLESVRQNVDKEDEGTGAMKSVQDMVEVHKTTIGNALQGVKTLLEQRKQQEQEAERMRAKQEEMKRQQEEMERQAELRRQEEARKEEERKANEEAERLKIEEEAKQRELELQRKIAEEQERRRQLEAQEQERRRQQEEEDRRSKRRRRRRIFRF